MLFYSSDFPVLRYIKGENVTSEDEVYKLRSALTVAGDDRSPNSRLVISFNVNNKRVSSESNYFFFNNDVLKYIFDITIFIQVTIRLIFNELSTGYWQLKAVEISYGNNEYILAPPNMKTFLGAPRGYSFTCAEPLVFSNEFVSLTFYEIQVKKSQKFLFKNVIIDDKNVVIFLGTTFIEGCNSIWDSL